LLLVLTFWSASNLFAAESERFIVRGGSTWIYLEGENKVTVAYSNDTELTSEVSYAPQLLALPQGYRF